MKKVSGSRVPGKDGASVYPPLLFERYRDRLQEELRSVLPWREPQLYSLLHYHMGWANEEGIPLDRPLSQGKALRPTLCLFACEALGGDWTRALPAAVALELVHNFSLIHDDIQDRDKERRHRPTLWYLWGPPRALVAGNGMCTLADLALLGLRDHGIPEEKMLRASALLTQSYLEMIEGQYLDLSYEESLEITVEDYLAMVFRKTGALIQCSLELGALLASEKEAAIQAFARCGRLLGIAFQIRDDVLGIWGDQAATGKATGNDIWRKKKSLPVVYALEHAQGWARGTLADVYRKEVLGEGDVEQVLRILEALGAGEYAQSLAQEEASLALKALEGLPLTPWARREMEGMIHFLVNRDY